MKKKENQKGDMEQKLYAEEDHTHEWGKRKKRARVGCNSVPMPISSSAFLSGAAMTQLPRLLVFSIFQPLVLHTQLSDDKDKEETSTKVKRKKT